MKRVLEVVRNGWSLVKDAASEWSNDKAARLGAALSYYTVFSMAPLLLLVIAIAGLAFGREAAEGRIVQELSGLLGAETAKTLEEMIENASNRKGGILATVVGGLTLLLGATGVLVELQDALNTVWKVVPKPGGGIKMFIRKRLLSFSLVLGFGFLLIVSLVASAGLAAVGGWLANFIPGWVVLAYLLNYGISVGVIAVLVGLIFKVLPDVKMAFRDVWVGALVTSLLFHLGKFLIGLYIGKASVGSTFGAAGSLAVLLVWVYYTSQLVLFGAELTRVYANRFGSHVVPSENAVAVPETPLARLAAEKQIRAGGDAPKPRPA
jgi:membrane protein